MIKFTTLTPWYKIYCIYSGGGGGAAQMIKFTHVFVPSLCRFQLSTPSLQGLFALCALGLLQGDSTLTQATLQELSGLVKSGDKLTDVATLTAALKVQQVGSSGQISF